MATIGRFEEIEAWQRVRELANAIYDVSDEGRFARDFALRDQMRRAVVSVMSNIAEGFERDGAAEFNQFLSAAKGSAGEVRAQLYLVFDRRYVDEPTFQRLRSLAEEISRMLNGLMQYLQRSGHKGLKYR
ncbi:MAG: four helix bundle protein [Phycisphaeraceae bacterium]